MKSINQNEDYQPLFPKGNPFDVPQGYFDSFPSRIAEHIEEQEKIKKYPFSSYTKSISILAIAAMFVLISVIGFMLIDQKKPEISEEDISNYVLQQGIIDEFEIDDIVNYSSISTSSLASLDSITMKPSVSNEEAEIIERLLLEDDIELNDLIDEL